MLFRSYPLQIVLPNGFENAGIQSEHIIMNRAIESLSKDDHGMDCDIN